MVLFVAARWTIHFRRLWLVVFGAKVRFAVVKANHLDTPPVEWSTVRIRSGSMRVVEFDGYDLPAGYLTMIVPLDCCIRFRDTWHETMSLSGHTYRTAAKFDGWPLSVELWLRADPVGAVQRRETLDKLRHQARMLAFVE